MGKDSEIIGYRPYQPFGSAMELLTFTGDECVLSGPAGTGKSRVCLEKIFAIAEAFPGSRQLMVRKTRESLTEAALVTWEEKVVPAGHPCLSNVQRRNRQAYLFPNGSVVVVGGMDKPTKIMSTEYDIVYCQELIEFTEADWEALSTRLRNGIVPYQQLIADTNPDGPQHWIFQRASSGKLRLVESRHEDNPTIFDPVTHKLTPGGAQYIRRLDNLTGVRKDRLRFGKWVQAEGIVYADYDAAHHLVAKVLLPEGWRDWRRIWVIDFGYNNPFVWQEWAIDSDGRMWRMKEIYQTKKIVEDHCKDILDATGLRVVNGRFEPVRGDASPVPSAVICDHDAEDRATFERHMGVSTIAAYKAKTPGIQAMQARLRKPEEATGQYPARMYWVADALYKKDDDLAEKKMPTCSEEEINAYIWDTSNGRKVGEEPVKKDDHGCDCARYACVYVDEIGLITARQWGAGFLD